MHFGGFKKQILFSALVAILMIGQSVGVFAATSAGSVITPATLNIQYYDGTDILSVDIPGSEGVTVDAIYGLQVSPSETVTLSLLPGETGYIQHEVNNAANTTDNISFALTDLTASWLAVIYLDENNDGIHQSSETTTVSLPLELPQETTVSVFVAFTAPNGFISPAKVIFNPSTGSDPNGPYVGFNNISYGGAAEYKITDNAEMSGSELDPPVIVPLIPTGDQLMVPTTSAITFYVEDMGSGVATSSLMVTINGMEVMTNGVVSSGFGVASIVPSGSSGYEVSIIPNVPFAYYQYVTVDVAVTDLVLPSPNLATSSYTFQTAFDPNGTPRINISLFLQGYYDPANNTQKPATINLQFRVTKFGPAVADKDVTLNASGSSGEVMLAGVTPGIYYLAIYHKLPGQAAGVNHIPILLDQVLPFNPSIPVRIDMTTSPNTYFYHPYVSATALAPSGQSFDPFYTVNTGYGQKKLMRGGNLDFDAYQAVNILDYMIWRDDC